MAYQKKAAENVWVEGGYVTLFQAAAKVTHDVWMRCHWFQEVHFP